jgi:hypothetical protein
MPLGDGRQLGLITTDHLGVERCPHCNTANPTLARRQWFYVQPRKAAYLTAIGGGHIQWHVYSCESCGGLAAAACLPSNQLVTSPQIQPAMWIVPAPKPISSDVPQPAARYLLRARETISSPEASVVMSASAVDAMLKLRNYTNGKLYGRIQQAETDGVLTKEMAAWAHDIRLDANDERHADQGATAPTPDDANRCLEFAETIADLLFVLPARVKRGLKHTQPST